jgi:peptide chain release factor 3
MDREGKDPFDLLDEIEEKLKIKVHQLSWPINMGSLFKGVYNIHKKSLNLFRAGSQRVEEEVVSISDINDAILEKQVGEQDARRLRDDVELIEGVYGPLDKNTYLEGTIAPVFFGSAINNFGVKELLESFTQIAKE